MVHQALHIILLIGAVGVGVGIAIGGFVLSIGSAIVLLISSIDKINERHSDTLRQLKERLKV